MKVNKGIWDGLRKKQSDRREHRISEAVGSVACLKNSKKASELENKKRKVGRRIRGEI